MSVGLGVVWAGVWMAQNGLFRLMDFLETSPITQQFPVWQPLVFWGGAACFVLAFILPGLSFWLSRQWLANNTPRWQQIAVGLNAILAPIGVGLALLWLCSLRCLWLQKTVAFLFDFKMLSDLLVVTGLLGATAQFRARKSSATSDHPAPPKR